MLQYFRGVVVYMRSRVLSVLHLMTVWCQCVFRVAVDWEGFYMVEGDKRIGMANRNGIGLFGDTCRTSCNYAVTFGEEKPLPGKSCARNLPGTLIRHGENEQEVRVIVKHVSTAPDDEAEKWRAKIELHRKIPPHDRLVQFFGGKVEKNSSEINYLIFMVTERMDENLQDFLLRPSTFINECTFRNILEILVKVAEGLQHLHSNGVVHTCLHPENILISWEGSRMNIKIMDYQSMMNETSGHITTRNMVHVDYFPLELLTSPNHKLLPHHDVFSFGSLIDMFLKHPQLVGEYQLATPCGPSVLAQLAQDCKKQLPHIGQVIVTLEGFMKNEPWVEKKIKGFIEVGCASLTVFLSLYTFNGCTIEGIQDIWKYRKYFSTTLGYHG